MKSHKKILIILMPVLIYSSCTTLPAKNQAATPLAQIQSIKLGLPLEKVRSRLGSSTKVAQVNWYGQNLTDWTYDLKNGGSIDLFCRFHGSNRSCQTNPH
jgi:hypothetical protein